MIDINLLPESTPKKPPAALPLKLLLMILILFVGWLGYACLRYRTVTIPELERENGILAREKAEWASRAEEYHAVEAESSRMASVVTTVRGLYLNRVVWAKILSDLKNKVTAAPPANGDDAESRYLWLDAVHGLGKRVELSGYAAAPTRAIAMLLPEQLVERLGADADEGAETGDAQPVDIGRQSFAAFLIPGSLKLEASWSDLPLPRGTTDRQAERFPRLQARSFRIGMDLK